jgi:hypothetical protein
MKILIDIPDNKAASFLEVIRSISYVKAKQLSESKAEVLNEVRESIEEYNLVKKGEVKSRPVEDLLDEVNNENNHD